MSNLQEQKLEKNNSGNQKKTNSTSQNDGNGTEKNPSLESRNELLNEAAPEKEEDDPFMPVLMEDQKQQLSNDLFVNESLKLIGKIYQLTKLMNISSNQFERIIMRSYERVWEHQDSDYKDLPGGETYN